MCSVGLLLLQCAAGAAADAAVETEPNQLAFIAPTQYRPIFVSFCQFRFVLAHHQETLSSHMVCTIEVLFSNQICPLLADSIKRHHHQAPECAKLYCKRRSHPTGGNLQLFNNTGVKNGREHTKT